MAQLSLFTPPPVEPATREPDLGFVRKTLRWRLRWLRHSSVMPWSKPETESLERHLPELARLLPEEEANAFIADFGSELARLRAVGKADASG